MSESNERLASPESSRPARFCGSWNRRSRKPSLLTTRRSFWEAVATERDRGCCHISVFGFFCGVRPDGELPKASVVRREAFRQRPLFIRPEGRQKGVGGRRFVGISSNAIAWIRGLSAAAVGKVAKGPVTPYEKSLLTKKAS